MNCHFSICKINKIPFTEPAPGSSQNSLGSVHEASSPIEQVAIPPGNVAIASYVIGPMVVRVLPDGRPVPGTNIYIIHFISGSQNFNCSILVLS